MNEFDDIKAVEATMTSNKETLTRKDAPLATYVGDDDGARRDALFASKTDIAFMPGTATVVIGDNGEDVDDLEARVAQKMMKEDDLKKYHASFAKDTTAKFFASDNARGKRDLYLVWMLLLTLVFIGLVVFGFLSGLFLPASDDAPTETLIPTRTNAERQAYMEELLGFLEIGSLKPSSPQEQAIEWMAFDDLPIPGLGGNVLDGQAVRLEQRYALAVWYFAQGGPKLWSSINRDATAGWMNHGIGVHECDWHAVDCEGLDDLSVIHEIARVVVGLRLGSAAGIVLTGTSLSTELGMLTNLRRVDFSEQRLEGSIPEEWRALIHLGTSRLLSLLLIGAFLMSFLRSDYTEMLVLSKNVIQGEIPAWIGDSWSKLKSKFCSHSVQCASLELFSPTPML